METSHGQHAIAYGGRMPHLEVISRSPAIPSKGRLLFVHGAWHGAWCWEAGMLDRMAEAGYEAHALDLRNHGRSESQGSLRWIRYRAFVDDLRSVIDELGDVVVVGHSMGGYLAQKLAEEVPPSAMILLAPVPVSGTFLATLRFARRHPWQYAKVIGGLHLWPVVGSPALAGDMLLSDAEHPQAAWLHEQLQDESFLTYLDMMFMARPAPHRAPSTPATLVIGGDRDRLFSVDEFEATARAWSGELTVLPGVHHDLMFGDGSERVADRMIEWLDGRHEAGPAGMT